MPLTASPPIPAPPPPLFFRPVQPRTLWRLRFGRGRLRPRRQRKERRRSEIAGEGWRLEQRARLLRWVSWVAGHRSIGRSVGLSVFLSVGRSVGRWKRTLLPKRAGRPCALVGNVALRYAVVTSTVVGSSSGTSQTVGLFRWRRLMRILFLPDGTSFTVDS